MKIGIVTIYEPTTNYGSFLQAYALARTIQKMGHSVLFVEIQPKWRSISHLITKLNPKRALFMRLRKAYHAYSDLSRIKCVPASKINDEHFDALIYGSDEIWNLNNRYFLNDTFWGLDIIDNTKKIAYAPSVGHSTLQQFKSDIVHSQAIKGFNHIFPRDENTKVVVDTISRIDSEIVCDPTILAPLSELSLPIKLSKEKYLLAYTYGIDNQTIELLTRFAQEERLKIVTPCFWHKWSNHSIACSALQLSTLMANAEYVFTTTFHGAMFALLNHTNCAILPLRPKVSDLVLRLGQNSRLLPDGCSYSTFKTIITSPFDNSTFDCIVNDVRDKSLKLLSDSLMN